MPRLTAVVVALLFVVPAVLATGQVAPKPEVRGVPTAASVVAAMRAAHSRLRSLEADVVLERRTASALASRLPAGPAAALLHSIQRYSWAWHGDELFCEERDAQPGMGGMLSQELRSGGRYYLLERAPGAKTAARGQVTDEPRIRTQNPLAYGMRTRSDDGLGLDLADALAGRVANVAPGGTDPRFGRLLVLEAAVPSEAYAVPSGPLFGTASGSRTTVLLSHRLWVAPERGYLVVRDDEFHPAARPTKPGAIWGAPISSMRVTQVRQTGGVWLPLSATTNSYQQGGQWAGSATIVLSNVRVNKASPALFRPRLAAGAQVFDWAQMRMTVADGHGKLVPDKNGVWKPRSPMDRLRATVAPLMPSAYFLAATLGVLLLAALAWRAWAGRRVEGG